MWSESQITEWTAKGYLTGQETDDDFREIEDLTELVANEHDCAILDWNWDDEVDGDKWDMSARREELDIWYDESYLQEISERFWDTVLEPLVAAGAGYYVSLYALLQPLLIGVCSGSGYMPCTRYTCIPNIPLLGFDFG
jgi:hypothetical protein